MYQIKIFLSFILCYVWCVRSLSDRDWYIDTFNFITRPIRRLFSTAVSAIEPNVRKQGATSQATPVPFVTNYTGFAPKRTNDKSIIVTKLLGVVHNKLRYLHNGYKRHSLIRRQDVSMNTQFVSACNISQQKPVLAQWTHMQTLTIETQTNGPPMLWV